MVISCYKFINFFEKIVYISTISRATHIINLLEDNYICLEFQDQYLPCHHIMAICKNQVLDSKDFSSFVYIIDNYHNIYSKDFVLDLI